MVWWLAQALTTLDRMTPNAFTGRAERTQAARDDPTTRCGVYDGGCRRLKGAWRWVAKGEKGSVLGCGGRS